MSTIPRLPPAENDLDVSYKVPKEDRPYLTEFYLATKKEGDTPDSFSLKIVKLQARAWYAQKEKRALDAAIDEQADTDRQELRADSRIFIDEV